MPTQLDAITLHNGSTEFIIPTSLERTTVLYFMRAAVCPQCNRHAREIDGLRDTLAQKGIDAIIIVPEDSEVAAKVKARNRITIPVMASTGDAHQLAGLDRKLFGMMQQSGTILVDASGTILYKKVATNPENSFNEQEFTDYLATL